MKDRTINVDSQESATWENEIVDTRWMNVVATESQSFPITRYIRERVPTGGRAIPETEKPFINGTLKVQFPTGPVNRRDGGYLWRSSGPHSNSFTMRDSGEPLTGTLEFPMNGTRFPRANSGAIYPPGVNADLLSQAEVKALNKLREKGTATSLNFGMVWAERKETIALFASATQATLKVALALRSGDFGSAINTLIDDFRHTFGGLHPEKAKRKLQRDFKNARRSSKKLLDQMANLTLAWNLGITPLMKDLEAANELLQTGILTRDWNLKSVSKYSRTINDRDQKSWPDTGVTSETTVSETHGYTVTLIGRPKSTIEALLGVLGLNNPLSLLYQATTGTFIIDYFYALGPWLDSLTVAGEFTFHGGSWTQKVSRVVTQTIVSSAGPVRGGYVLNYVNRRLYDGFPLPLPPLSLRERQLSDKQVLNTGLVALQKLKQLLS